MQNNQKETENIKTISSVEDGNLKKHNTKTLHKKIRNKRKRKTRISKVITITNLILKVIQPEFYIRVKG